MVMVSSWSPEIFISRSLNAFSMQLTTIIFALANLSMVYGTCRTIRTNVSKSWISSRIWKSVLVLQAYKGTRTPADCVFPLKFKFNGKEYSSCTTDGDPDKKPWCPIELDSKGGATKRWGHCDPALCSTGSTNKPPGGSNVNDRSKACRTVSHIEITCRHNNVTG